MSIEITHIRFQGTDRKHDAITAYKWRGIENGEVGSSDKSALVEWVDNNSNGAHVGSGTQRSTVGVWRESGKLPWLQTYADGKWNNNLLALPTF